MNWVRNFTKRARTLAQEGRLRGVFILPSVILMMGGVVVLERPDLVGEVVAITLLLGAVLAAYFAQRLLLLRQELRNIINQSVRTAGVSRGDSLVSGVRAFNDRVVQSNPAVPAEQYQPLRGAKIFTGEEDQESTLVIELRESAGERGKKITIH